jgi:hypothetical protein
MQSSSATGETVSMTSAVGSLGSRRHLSSATQCAGSRNCDGPMKIVQQID